MSASVNQLVRRRTAPPPCSEPRSAVPGRTGADRPAMPDGPPGRSRRGVLLEVVERGLTIADGGQLAAQQVGRSAVRAGLLARIDYRHTGAGPQRRAQVPK